jgi:hypothetical protein
MSVKKVWNDPVGSKVIATGVCALLAAAGAWWWHDVVNATIALWNYVTADIVVPRWVAGVVSLWALLTTGLLVALRIEAVAEAKSPNDWRSYRTDEFFGLRWRWKLFDNGRPYDICVFCPACDYQLNPEHDNPYYAVDAIRFQCHCGHAPWRYQESWDSLESRVTRTIQQRLRNGTWLKQSGQAAS